MKIITKNEAINNLLKAWDNCTTDEYGSISEQIEQLREAQCSGRCAHCLHKEKPGGQEPCRSCKTNESHWEANI